MLNQLKLALAGELFDLRLANAGAAAVVSSFDKDHLFRAAATKIFCSGTAAEVLVKTPLNVCGNTGVEGIIGGPNQVYKPFIHALIIHALAARSATIKSWQYWQRYLARR